MYKSMGRNRMIKRTICGVLASVMLCTSVDVSVFATENDRIKESSAAEGTEDILEGNQLSEVSSNIVNFDDSEGKRNAGEQDKEEGKDDKNDRDRNAVEQNSEEEDKEEQYEEIISNDGDGEANLFSGGTGTEDDPYLISSVEDMENIPQSTGSLAITSGTKTYYRLTKDLTLNNWTTRNMPLGCFDGGGHTIYDLKVVQGYLGGNTHGAALFCDIWSIKNLTVENAEVSTDNMSYYKYDYSPSVFAIHVNSIENCSLKGTVLLKGSGYSGGFVSKVEKSIKNCENYANITVKKLDEEHTIYFGGFVCTANGSVENLINQEGSSIDAEGETGGIAERANSLKNCINYADISIGDVIYNGQKSILSASGIVLHAGSIYANKPFTISNCINFGDITSSYGHAAGISIDISGGSKGNYIVVQNCSNEGNISSQYDFGECAGIAVRINSNVRLEGCNNSGIIAGNKIGGIAYEVSCKGVKIACCYNKGELRLCYYSGIAGGIIGSSQGGNYYDGEKHVEKLCIENCYNCGKVERNDATNVIVGGIIASWNMAGHLGDMPEGKYAIRNCYNNVAFNGYKDVDYVAGIIGYYYYSRTDYENYGCEVETGSCYCLDRGYSYIPTYYDEHDKEYKQDNEYVSEAFSGFKQCTDAQMKKQETYEGFDFGSVWAMGEDDYPYPIIIGNGSSHSGYEITLDPNGGTVSDTVLYTNKTGKLISLPRAKKDGKHFLGWYSLADGGYKIDTTTVFAEDTTIYAHWGEYNAENRVEIIPVSPAAGEQGVNYLNGTFVSLTFTFETSKPVKSIDTSSGAFKIINKKTGKSVYESESRHASLFKINRKDGGSSISFTYNSGFEPSTEYYVEIEDGFLVFEDENLFACTDEDEWNFKTAEKAVNVDIELPYDGNKKVKFSPDMFGNSSYEYDQELSELSVCLSTIVYENVDKDEYQEHKRIARQFQKLGFDSDIDTEAFIAEHFFEDSCGNIDDETNRGNYSPSWIVHKTFTINGEDVDLLCIVIRGTYGAEWIDNFDPADGITHLGFERAADYVLEKAVEYRDKKIKNKIKVLVTGHSRGAAVANIIGKKIDDSETDEGRKNIFIYTYASPNSTSDKEIKDSKYNNIFNIINPEDFVTKVLPRNWGYGRYGINYILPSRSIYPNGFYKYPDYDNFISHVQNKTMQYMANNPKSGTIDREYKPYDNGMEEVTNYVSYVTQTVQNINSYYMKNLAIDVGTLGAHKNSEDTGYSTKSKMEYKKYSLFTLYTQTLAYIMAGKEYEGTNSFVSALFYLPWGTMGEKTFFYFVKNGKVTPKFGCAHTPETYMAMLDLVPIDILKAPKCYNKEVISCPVDVTVKDSAGNVIGSVVNNNVTETTDELAMKVEGDSKSFFVHEGADYKIELTGNDAGAMDYTVIEYDADAGETGRAVYQDIPLEKGTTYIQNLSGYENAEEAPLLDDKSQVVEKTLDMGGDDIGKLSVSVNIIGNGHADSYDSVTPGDYVVLTATADTGSDFEGWYDEEGNLISTEAQHGLSVKKNEVFTAKFKDISGIRISSIEPQEYTGYVITPDIMLYDGSQELTQGADYTVSYKNNKNAFTFEDEDKLTDAQKKKAPQATIKMKGSYTGQKTVYFNIAPLKIEDGSLFEASLKPGKTPKVVFKYNDKALKENRDYKVDEISSDSVTITGTGNFTGTCTFPLKGGTELTVVSISKAIADPIPVQYYTGAELTGDTFKMGPDGDTKYEFRICYPKGEELKEGSDYEIAKVINGRKPGTGTVVIKGLRADGTGEGSTKYSFTGERYLKFKIAQRSIELAEVTSSGDMFAVPYNKAGAKIPGLTVTVNGTVLKEGRDYTVKYSKNTAFVGTSTTSGSDPVAVITGKGNYKDTKKVNFTIVKREFSTVSGITVVAPDRPEGKKAGDYATAVKVFDSEGKLLKAGTDYEKDVKYFTSDGNEAIKDTYPKAGEIMTVKVTGMGGYSNGTIEASYKILNKGETNDISKASIKIDQLSFGNVPATLDGNNAGKVHAAIGKDKKALTFSTDGTSGDLMVLPGSYVNNDRKGTASVTLIGINGYSGCKTVKFKVGAKSLAEWWKGLFK